MGNTLEVLRGIDLTINEGEVVGIVGQSGAGKSTFLHCLGTLDIVTGGSLKIAGEELTLMNNARLADLRNRTIGFVFQFHHLLPEFTALENVVMPGLIQGKKKREMEPRALALLEEVGLKNRASHRPGELSGGEQQRVALARALVLEPKASSRRRADWQLGLRHERANSRALFLDQSAAQNHDRGRHAQPRACREHAARDHAARWSRRTRRAPRRNDARRSGWPRQAPQRARPM